MAFGAFPGMGAVPGAQPQQAPGAGFVLNIPADPNWEPIETTDTLEMDGYYMLRIKHEKPRLEGKVGVWITFEILDEDARSKTVSKFMPNSASTLKDTWFLWRGLFRSITGGLDAARAAFQYVPGMLTNQLVYARSGAYADDTGAMRTGVDAFVTKAEYDEAVMAKKHRWPAKARGGVGAGVVGSLPTGLPSAFPGMGGMGLPGAPATPTGGMVPAPTAAAPMVQAPQGFPAAFTPPGGMPAPAASFTVPLASFTVPLGTPAASVVSSPAQPAAFAFPPVPQMPVTAQQATAPAAFAFPPPPVASPQPGAPAFPFPPAPGSQG